MYVDLKEQPVPMLVIVGPTASGKTDVAIKIARSIGGEIICADSRTVYKDLDIGTAKPSASDLGKVKHWGLDLVNIDQGFSASDFKTYAVGKISEIRSRGLVPILVGGSGLYIDSILFNYKFSGEKNNELRKKLENKTVEQLIYYCKENNIRLPENYKNKRYLIRTIESNGVKKSSDKKMINNVFVVGISTDKEELRERARQRSCKMLQDGLVGEFKIAAQRYGFDNVILNRNAYGVARRLADNKVDKSQAIEEMVALDMKLIKKQQTWFKRNKEIRWMKRDDIENFVTNFYAKLNKNMIK